MAALTPYALTVVQSLDDRNIHRAALWLHRKDESGDLIDQLRPQMYPNSQARYRFPARNEEAIAKAIFDAAFQRAPEKIIAAAEAVEKTSFYPLGKRVTRIYLPYVIGAIVGSKLVKLALVIATGYFLYQAGHQAYEVVEDAVTQAVPYILEHTPSAVINVYNTAIECLGWLYENWTDVVFYTWVGRQVILLGPEVPHVTAFVRAIDIARLFRFLSSSPQTIGYFLFEQCASVVRIVWRGCNNISEYFHHVAEKAWVERMEFSKQRAYAVWVRERVPVQVT